LQIKPYSHFQVIYTEKERKKTKKRTETDNCLGLDKSRNGLLQAPMSRALYQVIQSTAIAKSENPINTTKFNFH
jgi:hypothetical protein